MRNSVSSLILTAVLIHLSLPALAFEPAAESVSDRAKIPPEDQVAAICEEAKGFYEAEFKQLRTESDRIQLAEKLAVDAADTAGDDKGKYALLRLAQDLSIEAGDLDLTLQIADSIASEFAVSDARATAEAVVRFTDSKKRIKPDQRSALASEALQRIDPLLDEGNIELARRLAKTAMDSARVTRQFVLHRQVKEIDTDLLTLEREQHEFVETTKNNPQGNDLAVANTLLGKFNCFVMNDWDTGLPQLRNGSDAQLSEMARLTLLEGTDPIADVKVADQWWEFSEGLTGRKERVVKRFATSTYEQLLPDLNGLHKKRAETRVDAARELDIASVQVNQQADANQDLTQKPISGRFGSRRRAAQEFTASGNEKLAQLEIDAFVNQCRGNKAAIIDGFRRVFNVSDRGSSRMTPAEIVQTKELFEFLSKDEVLIVPRSRVEGGPPEVGHIFKPSGPYDISYAARSASCPAETTEIIDKHRAYVKLADRGPVIVEGIDTSKMPLGKWDCYFLLKRVKNTELPGIIGQKEVLTFQAISIDEFPKGIILW